MCVRIFGVSPFLSGFRDPFFVFILSPEVVSLLAIEDRVMVWFKVAETFVRKGSGRTQGVKLEVISAIRKKNPTFVGNAGIKAILGAMLAIEHSKAPKIALCLKAARLAKIRIHQEFPYLFKILPE